ncbi:ROK family protein [Planococcus sp. CP5-4]|uniref:ROK family protein n=1 Tax=unclassified Planococcus (in: firmicutes) TaxID=2662419 RepID=UPI001C22525C|nr:MULTISPECIES: ROK family protein [unclassified Planococcus (in: firmicutes)]MBU9674546.1 ROK family protein [Planococcus sp. CP5-4_YE]MBV0910286.1 ROK family protein [Planococcus sp. CP5-4_UN]MBW6065137.1 ROK family protein [Planococcus sp. CP5-4]
MSTVIGVDIGGTKIRMGVIDREGRILAERQVKTEFPLYPYLERQVLLFLKEHPDVSAIGIGTHGFVDPQAGRIVFAGDMLPGWTGTEVKAPLEQASGRYVEVENDANCAALAEATFGAATGLGRVVCITLGTGLGGGIIWDGKLLSGGTHGGAAELGHMILYPNGARCACGRLGCAEQYVSGTALVRRIGEAGLSVTPPELFELAKTDAGAKKLVAAFTEDLAIYIGSLQAIFDMDMLIIGGGVSESAAAWIDELNRHLANVLLNPLPVEVAQFENDAGMLGAALLVLDR